jgi:cysteine desulfurase
MQEAPIYLDYNATTPVLPEVVDAMLPFLREHFGNPSSAHAFGKPARDAIARARSEVALLLGCDAEEILFTSSGTEANNLALRGVAEACERPGSIVTSAIEHPATLNPCSWLERHGWRVSRVGVDANGQVRRDEVTAALDRDTKLVSVMHANNETGVLQPVAEVAAIAHAHGALVHADAAQSVGKVAVRVAQLGVDLLSIAGHKLYAPKGVGALFVRRGTRLAPVLLGAGHEGGLRPGTENVAGIVGLGAACVAAARDLESETRRVRGLRDRLWDRLREGVPMIALNGHPTVRLPNTLNVRFPGISGQSVLAAAPEVAASTGSACHAGHEEASAVIVAMGVAAQQALGSVRLTLGRQTTEEDVERAANALVRACHGLSEARSRTESSVR